MICLDTNYLIRGLVASSKESERLVSWYQSGELLIAPALVWYEFLCGPVTEIQQSIMMSFIHQILPFHKDEALLAAELFNRTGRQRQLRVDCMIAATAIVSSAPLATANQKDFARFVSFGLVLV